MFTIKYVVMARIFKADKEWLPQVYHTGVSEVPQQQLMIMSALFSNNSAVRSCYETLCRSLLSGGLRIGKKGFKLNGSRRVKMEKGWLMMCRIIIQQLVTFGFMFIHIKDDVPVHIDPCLLAIYVRRDEDGLVHYHARYRNNFVKLPEIYVIERNAPDIHGNLTSPLRSVLQHGTFTNLLLACAAKAEQRKASPPVFTESTTNNIRTQQIHRDYTHPGEMRSLNYDNRSAASLEHEDLTRSLEAFVTELNSNRSRMREAASATQAKWVYTDPATGVPNYPVEGEETNFASMRFPLPENQKLVQNVPSRAPEYLVQYTEMYHEEIAKIFGVPPGLFGSERSAVAVNQTILNTYSWTLQDYRVMLQTVITGLLDIYYGEENSKHAMKHQDMGKTTDQNYEAHRMSVSLPGILDPEIINMFYDRGYMEYSVVRRLISSYYGIPQEDLSEVRLDGATDTPAIEVAESQSDFAAQQKSMHPHSVMPVKTHRHKPYPNQRPRDKEKNGE